MYDGISKSGRLPLSRSIDVYAFFGPKGRHNVCLGCKAPESSLPCAESPDRGDTPHVSPTVSPLLGLDMRRVSVTGALQLRQELCQPFRA